MKNREISIIGFCILCLSAVFYSCEDLIYKDIKDPVNLLAPQDALKTPLLEHEFLWEEVDQAEHYQLWIVSPSFANMNSLVMDTTLTKTQFSMQLEPGKSYEWGVRALNPTDTTIFYKRTLEIDSTFNLQGQTIVIFNQQDSISSKPVKQFTWQTLPMADNYLAVIKQDNNILYNELTEQNSLTFDFQTNGRYQFSVSGLNDFSASKVSKMTYLYDDTAPDIPENLEPLNDTLDLTDEVKLSWTFTQDEGAMIDEFELQIASDSTFNSNVRTKTLSEPEYALDANNYNILTPYWWRVKAIDQAENESEFTNSKRFYVEK